MYLKHILIMDKNVNVLDVLAEAAREHTGEVEIPEVAVVCDAWDAYCRSHASAVSFGSKVVKDLDPEVARMVWDKIPTERSPRRVSLIGQAMVCRAL